MFDYHNQRADVSKCFDEDCEKFLNRLLEYNPENRPSFEEMSTDPFILYEKDCDNFFKGYKDIRDSLKILTTKRKISEICLFFCIRYSLDEIYCLHNIYREDICEEFYQDIVQNNLNRWSCRAQEIEYQNKNELEIKSFVEKELKDIIFDSETNKNVKNFLVAVSRFNKISI